MRNPGAVLSRDQLREEVWGDGFEPSSNVVDIYVHYVRRKLKGAGAGARPDPHRARPRICVPPSRVSSQGVFTPSPDPPDRVVRGGAGAVPAGAGRHRLPAPGAPAAPERRQRPDGRPPQPGATRGSHGKRASRWRPTRASATPSRSATAAADAGDSERGRGQPRRRSLRRARGTAPTCARSAAAAAARVYSLRANAASAARRCRWRARWSRRRRRCTACCLLLLGVAGSLVVAAAGGWFLAGKSLAPVRAAFDRQHAFVADASHELRTPLAVIRANAEFLQQRAARERGGGRDPGRDRPAHGAGRLAARARPRPGRRARRPPARSGRARVAIRRSRCSRSPATARSSSTSTRHRPRGAGRPRPAAPARGHPGGQRPALHARGRPRHRGRRRRRRHRGGGRLGHRDRHPGRCPRARLRAVLPGRRGPQPRVGRGGPRALDRRAARDRARRPDLGRERPRPGQHLHDQPAARPRR